MKRETLEEILKAGIRAPSADNTQPWKFILKNPIEFHLEPRAALDFAASGMLTLYVSAGAVIENMRVAALSKGFHLQAQYFPRPGDPLYVAALSFDPKPPQAHRHEKVLESRLTNRRFYLKKPISQEIYGRLEQTAAEGGMKLLYIRRGEAGYKTLERILRKADQLRYEVERLHREFIKTLRFGPAETTQDGLPIAALESGPMSDLVFKWMSSWNRLKAINYLGASAGLGFYTQLQMNSSEAAALLVSQDSSSLTYARAGEVMERVWHEAALNEIAMQPMEALPIFILNMKLNLIQDFSAKQKQVLEEMKKHFDALFKLKEQNGLIMLWRMGYAPPPTMRSNRRPVKSFIEENEHANLSV